MSSRKIKTKKIDLDNPKEEAKVSVKRDAGSSTGIEMTKKIFNSNKHYATKGVLSSRPPYNFTPCPFPLDKLPLSGTDFESKIIELTNEFNLNLDFSVRVKYPVKTMSSLAEEICFGIKKPFGLPKPNEKHPVKALFYSDVEKSALFIDLEIKLSGVADAGVGVFAKNSIPRGYFVMWQGAYVNPSYADKDYSWSVMEYDEKTGIPLNEGEVLYDINPLTVNAWYGFINCGTTEDNNNIAAIQAYDKIILYTLKDINQGDELFVDYGDAFRHKMGIYYEGEEKEIVEESSDSDDE